MAKFIILYLGGNHPSTPEEGKQHFQKYMAWLAELGDAVVSPANPFKDTHTIQADGTIVAGGSSSISGYTIIEAASMDQALALSETCPFLQIGGSLEVSALANMPT